MAKGDGGGIEIENCYTYLYVTTKIILNKEINNYLWLEFFFIGRSHSRENNLNIIFIVLHIGLRLIN